MQSGSWGSDNLQQCELRVPVSSSAERKETMTQIHAEKSRGGRV